MVALAVAFIADILVVVQIGLDTDDRLDAVLFHRLIKVYRAEHIAVVGDRACLGTAALQKLGELAYFIRAV